MLLCANASEYPPAKVRTTNAHMSILLHTLVQKRASSSILTFFRRIGRRRVTLRSEFQKSSARGRQTNAVLHPALVASFIAFDCELLL